jgi:hypothetical protein
MGVRVEADWGGWLPKRHPLLILKHGISKLLLCPCPRERG